MRKNYLYAAAVILLALFFVMGYYMYLEYKPTTYKNGTFVELPEEKYEESREMSA